MCRTAAEGTCQTDATCDGALECPAETYANTAVCTGGAAYNGPCKSGYCDTADGGKCKSAAKPAETVCRTTAEGTCQTDATCDGALECPAETYANTAVCTGGAAYNGPCKTGYCDTADGGKCKSAAKPAETVCRTAAGVCDLPEFCAGSMEW